MSDRWPRSHELPFLKRIRLYAAGVQAVQNWDDVTELMEAQEVALHALLSMLYTPEGVETWLKHHRDLGPLEKVDKVLSLFGQVAT